MRTFKIKWISFVLFCIITATVACRQQKHLYIYNPGQKDNVELYDEAMAASCLQGILNRKEPVVYVNSPANSSTGYWLEKFTSNDRWLHNFKFDTLNTLDELFRLAEGKIKGAVIWDTAVAATLNVATTIAGVEDAIVLSPELATKYLAKWKLNVIKDLRGMFSGKETGSAKNDAYRWAIDNYLKKGLCSPHFVSLSEDAYIARRKGDIGYVVTRDWSVFNRSFVFDLSPWGDELPADDSTQKLGTDLETYKIMLNEILKQTDGKQMTEISGFFSFFKYSNMPGHKSRHEAVPTEWESVYLMSPYNCYQNTVTSYCYNQSVHSHAPVSMLKQHRPEMKKDPGNKTYICILMADYDSGTPLYDFLPKFWDDKRRGEMPFIWGINPNLIETYPDIIEYFYSTASKNDYFGADASAAGYMNPNRVLPQYLPLFIRHNQKFFRQLDQTIAPMVLDWDKPSAAVKDAFAQFSPDGYATIIYDFHTDSMTIKHQEPEIWKGMPVTELLNNVGNFTTAEKTAKAISSNIANSDKNKPGFYFFRITWSAPSDIIASIDELKRIRPDLDIEVTDPYNFFSLFKEHYKGN